MKKALIIFVFICFTVMVGTLLVVSMWPHIPRYQYFDGGGGKVFDQVSGNLYFFYYDKTQAKPSVWKFNFLTGEKELINKYEEKKLTFLEDINQQ